MSKIQKLWEKLNNNEVLRGEDYYISYNPETGIGHGIFTRLANILEGGFKDGKETALVKAGTFFILEGDFRNEYEKLDSFEECKAFFDSKKEDFGSNWSTNLEDRKEE